jgi:hypothetical protein
VDVEHAVTLVDAVDRAFVDAGTVFNIHAREGDDVRHGAGDPFDSIAFSIVSCVGWTGASAVDRIGLEAVDRVILGQARTTATMIVAP